MASCQPAPEPNPQPMPDPNDSTATDPPTFQYLALGDSYTIGERVAVNERWPVQLADSLRARGLDVPEPYIIARTGWSTDQLISAIEAEALADTFDMVSLLIGVNNQFRRIPIETYPIEFTQLLNTAIDFAQGNRDRVFVLSIPDYGVTPFGSGFDPERTARELDEYNAIAEGICDSAGVSFYGITDISREAAENPDLIAEDNLHPSGEMYRRWVVRILPEIETKLR